MAANLPTLISKTAQAGILEYKKSCTNLVTNQYNFRSLMQQIDLAYAHEKDQTAEHQKAKLANKLGDANKFQNITLPVVLPSVESAVVYQSSVFLSGNPIFGCVAPPSYEDAAMQMEALMENHSTRGGWIRHLQMFFRDGFKYNISALEVTWAEECTAVIDSDPNYAGGKEGKPKEIIWAGNKIERLDPYNILFDVRVNPTEIPKRGEFAGYTKLMSRIELKSFVQSLPNKMVDNLKEAYESGLGGIGVNSSSAGSYYIPTINQDSLTNINLRAGTDWLAWAGDLKKSGGIQYKNAYEVSFLYGRIIPSDFGIRVPSPNTPQVWKFIFVNHSVLIYAERQTNAHNLIPILFGQPYEDGLGYQTKSLAQNVLPIQSLTSALLNSTVAARRRAISDRGLFDPSRVDEHKINSDNPSAKIPVRPAAYGKPLGEAYFPIPFRDDQSPVIMQEISQIAKLSELISGQNPARQGQFVKGNKTQTEYSDVMNHSNGRDQNISILYEAQVFTPLKEILKLNILQYQGAGSLYYREAKQEVEIDPVKLRKAVIDFKISDGLTPASKLINGDSFQVALQVIGSSPQIGSQYNIGPMFSYMMKTQGALIGDFEKSQEQVAYEQAVSNWNQMGQLALSKGQKWDQPQPLPEQFGYLQDGALKQTTEKPPALESFIQTLATQVEAQNGQTS